jgi:hypothetical protein
MSVMPPLNTRSSNKTSNPRLRPAGQGLPSFETTLLKYVGSPLSSICLTQKAAQKMFVREGERLLYLAQDIDDWLLDQRVLVKRSPGMEDCSRHWSMEMLVEHNITVGKGIRNTLRKLLATSIPKSDTNVVNAKPLGGQGPEIRKDLQRFLIRFNNEFDGAVFRKGNFTLHPWFGKMNAVQWLRLAALNNLVHRVHGERIYEGMLHTNICE